MSYSLKHQISDLRQTSIQRLIESFFVFIGTSALAGFIQNMLITYYYANQQLFEEPQLLKYISMAANVLPLLFFAYVLFTNFGRGKKIDLLKKELMMSGDCCGGNCNHGSSDDSELEALEELVNAAIEEAEASTKKDKPKSKSKAKKSAKKSSPKKSSKKK